MKKIFSAAIFITVLSYQTMLYESFSNNTDIECSIFAPRLRHSQHSVVGANEYDVYSRFLKISKKQFLIPGLKESFVPQGITFCESLDSFMMSGYSDTGGAAYILSIDFRSGRINGEYMITKSDGSPFTGHSGGIAAYGRYVYISDGHFLYYIAAENFAGGSGRAMIEGEIQLPSAASYISTYGGCLWAGNFYHKSYARNYDAAAIDKYNKLYRTVIVAYRFDSEFDGAIRTDTDGIENTAIPFAAFFTPNEVQGIAFMGNGDVHLSSSYGRNTPSMQRLYDYPLKRKCDTVISLGSRNVPVWFLNNDNLKEAVSSFPMSEGVVHRDGKVYVVFESAAKKYLYTATDPTDCVWVMKWK